MNRFQKCLILAILAAALAAMLLREPARVIVIAAIAVLFVVLFSIGMATMRLQFFAPAICRGQSGKMRVALTFDDGPNPAATPALLDLLAKENVPATFFCIGQQVAAHPEIARRIVADGHLIGNHSFHHAWLTCANRGRGLVREFGLAQDAIRAATGQTPTYLRPPVGLTNPHFRYMLKRIPVQLIGWDVRPLDTMRGTEAVIELVLSHTTDGSIILLHDGGTSGERIAEIVSAIIHDLRSRGFSFERVDRLI